MTHDHDVREIRGAAHELDLDAAKRQIQYLEHRLELAEGKISDLQSKFHDHEQQHQ